MVADSTLKKAPPFLGPKHWNQFFSNLKHESIPVSVSKKIGDCIV